MRRSILTAMTAGLLALLLVPTASAAPISAGAGGSSATISTEVYGSDGLPIPGATLDLDMLRKSGYVDAAVYSVDQYGTADFSAKAGSYEMLVDAPSADPKSVYFTAVRSATYSFEVTLASYGTISGTVKDNSTGLPVAGATVDLFRENPDGSFPPTPSASVAALDGTYSSGELLAGSYKVEAIAPDYNRWFHDSSGLGAPTIVSITTGSALTGIDVRLVAAVQSGIITGRVVSGAGQTPLSSAYIMLYRQNDDGTWPATSPDWGDPNRTVHTDASGYYTSGEIPLGNYKVRFFALMKGSQWWQYVATVDLATIVTLDAPGETLSGINGWYGMP